MCVKMLEYGIGTGLLSILIKFKRFIGESVARRVQISDPAPIAPDDRYKACRGLTDSQDL